MFFFSVFFQCMDLFSNFRIEEFDEILNNFIEFTDFTTLLRPSHYPENLREASQNALSDIGHYHGLPVSQFLLLLLLQGCWRCW